MESHAFHVRTVVRIASQLEPHYTTVLQPFRASVQIIEAQSCNVT